MPVIAIGEIVLCAIAALVVGVAAVNASKSSPSNLISDEINEFTEAEKKLKAELFWGFVMITARIFSSSSESTNTENIESIEQSEASAAAGLGGIGIAFGGIGTAMSINLAQDEIQKIADCASSITAIPDCGSPIPCQLIPPSIPSHEPIPPFNPPVIPDGDVIPSPLTPPYVGKIGTPPLVPPDDGPTNPPPLIPPVEKQKGLGGNILFSKENPNSQTTNGETNSTKVGKQVHRERAEERRKSGEYDTVNEVLKDSEGNIIEVPKRINKEGKPSKKTQRVIPDAVQGPPEGNIIDDKPLGRSISKDKQEIRRFIDAYTKKYGQPPKKIRIERYNPETGEPAGEEVYDIDKFKIP